MIEKIKLYMALIKKYTFPAVIVITLIDIGLLFYFSFNHHEFRTIGYKLNLFSFYLTAYLIIIWLCILVIRPLWRATSENHSKQYQNILGVFCRAISCIGIIGVILLTFLVTFFMFMNIKEEECMEWCVLPDNSNYSECLFGTCEFPI